MKRQSLTYADIGQAEKETRLPRVVKLKVWCQGSRHVITIHTRGRKLVCHNHEHIDTERTLLQLAGEPLTGCLNIADGWENRDDIMTPYLPGWPFLHLYDRWLPCTHVSCQGELHRIIVGANGQLGFPDHIGYPGQAARGVMRTLLQLGGIPPDARNRCLDVLNQYRETIRPDIQKPANYFVHLPDVIKDVARRAWRVRDSRRSRGR